MTTNHTIAAVSTGEGGAIAMIRMSGAQAIEIADRVFRSPSGRTLSSQPGFSLAYGNIVCGAEVVDDVVVSVFRAPKSFTGEDMVEISCHGSKYIKQRILALLVENGAQPAAAGEFTMRAFLAGKLDLSQAEAVADLIAAESRESHSLAMNQMRGGYSEEFRVLREQLLELAALLELELDFGEEDVEFADREKLAQTISGIKDRISSLKNSFSLGNVLKKGVPVAIIGSPNVGKSTLLNALLNEERAMVSDIAGTTRDIIEDTVNIRGVEFRFIDTAGIRSTDDILESMGIERTLRRIASARIILYVFDHDETAPALSEKISELGIREDQQLVLILNKIDALSQQEAEVFAALVSSSTGVAVIPVSARSGLNIDSLRDHLYDLTGVSSAPDIIVTNARHYEALLNAEAAIIKAQELIASRSSADLLAEEIRDVIYHTGLIVGKIVSEEVLQAIFGKFCIGK